MTQWRKRVLLIRDEDVKTLNWFGLTKRQAKVYLALLQLGSSGADAISKLSGVHRQEVYRVAARLQEMGLTETNLTSPTHFSAVPAETALEIMVNQKTREFAQVRMCTKNIIRRYNQNGFLNHSSAETPYFTIVSGKDCLRKMQNTLEVTRRDIKIVATFKRFCQAFSIHEDLLQDALKNHVCIQVVTEQIETESLPKWVQQLLLEKPAIFELRTLIGNVQTTVVIYDDVRLCLAVNILADIVRGSQLWSNSRSLIALGREYFEGVWGRSERFPAKDNHSVGL